MAGQTCACGIGPQTLGFFGGQEQFAHRSEVQGGAAANGAHHLHARTLAVGALHVNDFIALTHAQVHRLLNLLVQFAHGQQGGIAHIEPSFDQVAQLQQAHAQTVAAGLGSVHKTPQGEVVQDAVRGGGVKPGFFADFFEADRLFARGQHIDQGKHTLDHLNGRRRGGHGFLVSHPAILSCETVAGVQVPSWSTSWG